MKIEEVRQKDDNNYKNYIIGEIIIKEEYINKNTQIINSFENMGKSYIYINKEDIYKYENEKEIKTIVKLK